MTTLENLKELVEALKEADTLMYAVERDAKVSSWPHQNRAIMDLVDRNIDFLHKIMKKLDLIYVEHSKDHRTGQ